MELSRPVVVQHHGHVTLTLDFQGQILKMLYLRNGRDDWHGTKGMWVDRMLDPNCEFELWPHSWPWPLIFKLIEWGGEKSFYSHTLMPSGAVMHKVKIHLFLYFFVRPLFGRQFVIRVDGCCANCVVALVFLPSRHTTWKQHHYEVRNDNAVTTSCARWVGLWGRPVYLV